MNRIIHEFVAWAIPSIVAWKGSQKEIKQDTFVNFNNLVCSQELLVAAEN